MIRLRNENKVKVRLINANNYSVVDQFTVNKSLEDAVKQLNEMYYGRTECKDGRIDFYVYFIKGE